MLSNNFEEYIELEKIYGANNYNSLPVVLSEGNGVWVLSIDGKKYLDCLSAYSALNFGHRHPKIIKALEDQLGKLTFTSRAFYNDKLGVFLERLCRFTDFEKALPMNTGAETVETGIKIARRWGYSKKKILKNKAEIIVCENNFHGRTTTIVGFSSDPNSYEGFGPKTPGFIKIPFNDPNSLENAINDNTAAFLVEPIQGEAGVIVPNKGYLREIRKICDENNILLILDEIQTGMGRTGADFCYNHEEIQPDILLVGKALGGGIYPVSAAITRKEIMDVITPGSHGSTFGGNPLAAAVGIASIDLLMSEKLSDKAKILGNFLIEKLYNLKNKYSDIITDIRGKGLLCAIELNPKRITGREFALKLLKKGILAKETHGKTIRLAPPLIIKKEELEFLIEKINSILIELE
ncbi:MAG: ornithine--oxo-acid transaminase [Promethearchaeota archaeon]